MRPPRPALAAALLAGLAACAAPAPPPATTMPRLGEPDACGASALQDLLGRPAVAARRAAPGSRLRIYQEGDPVTSDYIPERLNFVTDAEGMIMEIRCG